MKVSSRLPGDSRRAMRMALRTADSTSWKHIPLIDLPGSVSSRVQLLPEKIHLFLNRTIFPDPPFDGIDGI